MMWRDVVELLELVETPDGYGGYTTSEISRQVFCDQKSVKSSEWYRAHAVGLKPEVILAVRSIEYNDEQHVRWKDKVYDVLRTYSKNGEVIELTCAKRTEVL